MLYLASGTGAEEAAGPSIPLGGGKSCPCGICWESFPQEPCPGFVCSCVIEWKVKVCLPVQYLQPFLWLISDLHSSAECGARALGMIPGQMSPLVTSQLGAQSGKVGKEQTGTPGVAEWTELKGEQCFLLLNVAAPARFGDVLVGTFRGTSPKEPTVRSYLRNTSLSLLGGEEICIKPVNVPKKASRREWISCTSRRLGLLASEGFQMRLIWGFGIWKFVPVSVFNVDNFILISVK